jgi:hypothetical protein
MTRVAQDAGNSGALFEMSGTVPINATWSEDIYFQEAGSAMDLTGLSFKLTLRGRSDSSSADYTLSTDAGTLAITTDGSGVEVLRITVPPGSLSTPGDYVADLASEDGDDVVTLWAHGIIALRNNPVTF